MSTSPRFVIADPAVPSHGWTHIFEETGGDAERSVRFVYDREEEVLHHAEVKHGRHFVRASDIEFDDLSDSLVNANEEALADPEDWGLIAADDLPDWAPPIREPEDACSF